MALAWFNVALVPWLSGRTLLPVDILYAFEPWHSLAPDVSPHNPLIGDLALQTAPWWHFVRERLRQGELPLWNPQVLSGVSLLGEAQPGLLYPLNLLLDLLPVDTAYGWYTALHVALAGVGTFALARQLRLSITSALFSAVSFAFSGFCIVYAVSPQMLGAAAWLPMLLTLVERWLGAPTVGLWCTAALVVGTQFLAGHPEMSAYLVLTTAGYTVLRCVADAADDHRRGGRALPTGQDGRWLGDLVGRGLGVAALLALGGGLAAVQLVPTSEALASNIRQGSRSFADVLSYAWPASQLWTLLLPDLYGNPTQHGWFDLSSGTWHAATGDLSWGVKNYVEGAQYVGVTAWLLTVAALVARFRRRGTWTFATLGLVALVFMLGTPLYGLLEFGLPGFQQLNTPFRWVVTFTLAVAMLAGIGLDVALERRARLLATGGIGLGLVALGAVGLSLARPRPFLALADQLIQDGSLAQALFGAAAARAHAVFATPEMFWSLQALGLARLGLVAVAAGLLLVWRPRALLALTLLDLYSVHGGFFAPQDLRLSPLRSSGRPPVPLALEQDAEPWRFTTYNRFGEHTLKANAGMYLGWQDVRGYESIIPSPYVGLISRLRLGSNELPAARVGPFYGGGDDFSPLDTSVLDLLNTKYVLSTLRLPNAKLREVYRDGALGVYENSRALPRAFVAARAEALPAEQQPLEHADLRQTVFIESGQTPQGQAADARVARYAANTVTVEADLAAPGWLVVTDAYAPGWRATVRHLDQAAQELPIQRADGAFRTVWLPSGGAWTVDFRYEPASVRLGGLLSGLSLLLVGALLVSRTRGWRRSRPAGTAQD
ncbi:MAG TPA: YfhO family protein [Chloroflexota bacterium]|nr:YfhO family protein [Chloroflexota bacterium]